MAITQNGPVCAVVRIVQTSDVTWRLFVQLDRDGAVVWSMEQDVVLPESASPPWPALSSTVPSQAVADHDQGNARIPESGRTVHTNAALALTRSEPDGGIAVGSNLHISTRRVQQRAERFATYLVVAAMVGLIASIPALLRSGDQQVIARLPAPLDWAPESSRSPSGALLLPATDAEIPADWAVPRSSMHASAATTTGTAKAAAAQRHSHVSRPHHANGGRSLAAGSSLPRTNRAAVRDPGTAIAKGSAVGQVNAPSTLASTGALKGALERCAEGPIFGRTWCEHRARTEYCAGQSGRRPECPTYAGNEFRYISAN